MSIAASTAQEPLTTLVVGAALLCLVFWLLARWARNPILEKAGRRPWRDELMENALKQLFESAYAHRPLARTELAAALGLVPETLAPLLTDMAQRGLLVPTEPVPRLTIAGRTHALRVIRRHRLWEAYLAEHTGVPPEEWHDIAEAREHTTSAAQIEAMAAALGYPTHDPHGDPIPTVEGHLPSVRGVPLDTVADGSFARIVHIEDEPGAIYRRLLALDLHLGQIVQRHDAEPGTVGLDTLGGAKCLDASWAANVSVVPIERASLPERQDTLADLAHNRSAEITGITEACPRAMRRRLLDLGFVPGTRIQVYMPNPLGDPTAYRLRDTIIALRQDQARHVLVRPETANAGAPS